MLFLPGGNTFDPGDHAESLPSLHVPAGKQFSRDLIVPPSAATARPGVPRGYSPCCLRRALVAGSHPLFEFRHRAGYQFEEDAYSSYMAVIAFSVRPVNMRRCADDVSIREKV